MNLNMLFNKTGSDKGTVNGPAHNYGPVYERLFEGRNIRNLLEVGIEHGYSLRAWAEYFPAANIFGIDRAPVLIDHPRIQTLQADQNSEPSFWRDNIEALPLMDAIIDDGGHCMDHHITTLSGLWRKLRPGGLYIIEDVHTCNLPSNFTMYGQPLRNETHNTLKTFAQWSPLRPKLRSPFITDAMASIIGNNIAWIEIIGDDGKEESNISNILKHGLIIIQKKDA